MIYLDYNASSPVRDAVKKSINEAWDHFGNPSGVHQYGRKARSLIESSRDKLAKAVDCAPQDITFTSGGTEGNNWFLKGVDQEQGHIITSAIEHPSLHVPAEYRPTPLSQRRTTVPVNPSGVICLESLEKALQEKQNHAGPVWVSVIFANNETGVIQPLEKITKLARHYGAKIHTDGVQALGRIPFSFRALDIDAMTLSAHKIGGVKGAGCVVAKTPWPALISGTGQERSARAGTENVLGITAFGTAAQEIQKDDWDRVATLRNDMEDKIMNAFPEIQIFGRGQKRLPNTSFIHMPNVTSEQQVMAFDLKGIAVSAGSACSSGKLRRPHVLLAMGIRPQIAAETLRVSLGRHTTQQDIATFVEAWTYIYKKRG